MRVATCHRTSSWDMRCWGVRPAPDLSQRGKVILTVKCAPLPLAGRFTPPVPAAFHLFNPPGGGEAAAWQSTRCPDRYLVSFLQGERRLASNCTVSFLRIYTSFFAGWLTDINGRERISSLYIYFSYIILPFTRFDELKCVGMVAVCKAFGRETATDIHHKWLNRVHVWGRAFIVIMLPSLSFDWHREDRFFSLFFVQRVTARAVDCSKLSQLDMSQSICLSSLTD